jgi:glycosyltransferase involved in cell wall biosynthesis
MTLIEDNRIETPLFSICIPQYNRTSFLLKELDSFREQTFKSFEVCISDDCSTDGRTGELLDYLHGSGMSFRYCRPEKNGRYDKNLRASMNLARGRYCLLMGNDDSLASPGVLQHLSEQLAHYEWPEIVITNYLELDIGVEFRRIQASGMRGSGPLAAAGNYRNFAFVGGILLDRALAQKHTTDKWDGSEMYQMFIGTRIIAEGGRLFGLAEIMVGKNVHVPGEEIDAYWKMPVVQNCPIQERRLPLCQYGRVAYDAVSPFLSSDQRSRVACCIFKQFYQFTYPPWIVEIRRVQSWRYALGVALGMRPKNSLKDVPVNLLTSVYLRGLFTVVTLAGFLVPISLFNSLRPRLHALAKAWK